MELPFAGVAKPSGEKECMNAAFRHFLNMACSRALRNSVTAEIRQQPLYFIGRKDSPEMSVVLRFDGPTQ
jgi:hypothetical protein